MRPTLHSACAVIAIASAMGVNAQRYMTEVFTDAQVVVTPNVTFGTNIDFLTSDFSNPALYGPDVIQLQTLVSTQQPIPAEYYDPSNTATVVKVTDLKMDVYAPDAAVDQLDARPVMIYVHTGNALPPPLNGSPCGTRTDSSGVEICKRMARRGYVAVSMDYRLGWNPLGSTLEIRRGTLLNAIYRAIHDVKQCIRSLKADAAGANTYGIDPNKIVLYGEGTGGYITLATATLNHGSELFIEKFRPDPFDPNTSYIDTTTVGNIDGFGGALCLYRPNGQNSHFDFCVNAGGALADTSWLAPGDVPMVAFHTAFDPFAPFTNDEVCYWPVEFSNSNTYANPRTVVDSTPSGDVDQDDDWLRIISMDPSKAVRVNPVYTTQLFPVNDVRNFNFDDPFYVSNMYPSTMDGSNHPTMGWRAGCFRVPDFINPAPNPSLATPSCFATWAATTSRWPSAALSWASASASRASTSAGSSFAASPRRR